ncbi:MAG: MFS transporter [Candidatus Bathyarchaeota archaeon]|nr:MFS transporter [Candidatus Bathyarchaeota archaeon]
MPRGARLYLAGLSILGIADGIFVAIFQFYLIALGFTSAELGTVFMVRMIAIAILTLPMGVLSDRYGRARVLMGGQLFFIVGLAIIPFARTIEAFSLVLLLMGVAASAFVVMGPIYSSFFRGEEMDKAFGVQGFINITSSAAGSLTGLIPPMLVSGWGMGAAESYRLVLYVATAFYLTSMPFLVLSATSAKEPVRDGGPRLMIRSAGTVVRFSVFSALNGLGYSVFFGLLSYYAYTRFGATSAEVGVFLSASMLANAAANIVAPRLSGRIGTLRAISLSLGLSAPFYLLAAYAPSFAIFGTLLLTHIFLANICSPLSTSLYMKSLHDDEKGTAAGASTVANMSLSALGTQIGGTMMGGALGSPIYVGAAVYAANAAWSLLLRKETVKH